MPRFAPLHLCCIAAIMCLSNAQADQLIQKTECSISIPDGWTEMPRDILDAYENQLAQAAPAAARQHYLYGFQSPGKQWFEYPYMLIQRIDSGRIPEGELAKINDTDIRAELDKQGEAYSTVMSETRSNVPVYDSERNILWLTFEANIANVGPVTGITGMVPTQTGLIQASAYAAKAEFPAYEPVFRGAIASLTPSPELVYKRGSATSSGGRFDVARIVRSAVIFGIIGGIVGGLFALIKKRSA